MGDPGQTNGVPERAICTLCLIAIRITEGCCLGFSLGLLPLQPCVRLLVLGLLCRPAQLQQSKDKSSVYASFIYTLKSLQVTSVNMLISSVVKGSFLQQETGKAAMCVPT